MNTWITGALMLVFKVWAVKKCLCWDWNPMSSVKAGLKVIVGLVSACNFFDEVLSGGVVSYIYFFLFLLLRQVCVIVPIILLKLKWHHSNYYYNILLNFFGCNRGICWKTLSSWSLSWTWRWKIAWRFQYNAFYVFRGKGMNKKRSHVS